MKMKYNKEYLNETTAQHIAHSIVFYCVFHEKMQKPLSSLIHQSPNLHLAKMQFEKKLRQHLRIWGGAAADQARNGAVTSLGTFCSIETIICFLMQCFAFK